MTAADLIEVSLDSVAELSEIATLLVMTEDSLAGRVLDVAVRLQAAAPVVDPVDPGNTLFDAPRLRPPGSFYAVRRTDGEPMGEDEEAVPFVIVDSADNWRPAERDAGYFKGQTEYEMVLLVPKSIGKRTFGRVRTGDSTPRCSTVVGQ